MSVNRAAALLRPERYFSSLSPRDSTSEVVERVLHWLGDNSHADCRGSVMTTRVLGATAIDINTK